MFSAEVRHSWCGLYALYLAYWQKCCVANGYFHEFNRFDWKLLMVQCDITGSLYSTSPIQSWSITVKTGNIFVLLKYFSTFQMDTAGNYFCSFFWGLERNIIKTDSQFLFWNFLVFHIPVTRLVEKHGGMYCLRFVCSSRIQINTWYFLCFFLDYWTWRFLPLESPM